MSLAIGFAACGDDGGSKSDTTTGRIDSGVDTALPDTGADSSQPDQAVPDQAVPDQAAPDQGTPDTGADAAGDASVSPDQAVADALVSVDGPNSSCGAAKVITLSGGKASVNGDTTGFSSPYTLNCRREPETTTFTASGPKAFYRFTPVQFKTYRIRLTPTFSAYVAVSTNPACSEASIETDCQSGGATGTGSDLFSSNTSRVVYYRAATPNDIFIVVSGSSSTQDGTFKLDVEEVTNAPTNSTCANAQTITLTSGTGSANGETSPKLTPDEFSGVNCRTFGSSTVSSTTHDGPQAYYKFTAKQDVVYRITVTGKHSRYVHVFRNSACTEAAIDADCQSANNTKGGGRNSSSSDIEIDFLSDAVGDVYVAVDSSIGYEYGEFTITITERGSIKANSRCAGAQTITLTSGKGSVSGETDTTLTPNEFSGVNCRLAGSSSISSTVYDGPQLYYKFTGVQDQWYKIKVTADFGAYFYAFQGASCTEASIDTACQSTNNTNGFSNGLSSGTPEAVYFKAPATGDVYVAVDSTSPTTDGKFTIEVEAVTAPTNGTCATATPLTFTSGSVEVTGWMGPFTTPNEFGTSVSCTGGSTMDGPQAYYSFTATAGKFYRVTLTPGTRTGSMYAYAFGSSCVGTDIGNDCDNNTTAATSSSAKSFLYRPSASGTHHVAVDSTTNTSFGEFTLKIEELDPAANDTCQTAQSLSFTNGKATVLGDTAIATDSNTTQTCTSSTAFDGRDVFYRLTAQANHFYKISVSNQYSSGYVFAFKSSSCGTEASIKTDCSSNGASGFVLGSFSNSSRAVYFDPGTPGTYTIGIDGSSTALTGSGQFNLQVDELTAQSNNTCAAATTLTFNGNVATASGTNGGVADQFGGAINCGDATAYSGGQVYYKVALKANTAYYINASADFDARVYMFGSAANCQASAINTHCSSNGTSGDKLSVTANGSGSFKFTPTSGGDYFIAIDSTAPVNFGQFTVTVTEAATLTAPISLDFESTSGGLIGTGDWKWANSFTFNASNCDGNPVPPTNNMGPTGGRGMWGAGLTQCYSNAGTDQGSCSGGGTNPADDSRLFFNVTIPSGWTKATLTYADWFDVFTTFDWGEVRVDGTLVQSLCTQNQGWTTRTVDLTPYVGKTIEIAFHLAASSVVSYSGWYIDSLSISGN